MPKRVRKPLKRQRTDRALWEVRFPSLNDYGHSQRKSSYFQTENAADDAIKAWEYEQKHTTVVFPSNRTLKQWTQEWVSDGLRLLGIRASTVDSYRTLAVTHLIPSNFARLQLKEVTPHQVKVFVAELRTKGLSTSTIRTMHTILNHVFRMAIDKNQLRDNPMNSIRRPKQDEREQARFTAGEIRSVLEAAKTSRYYLVIAFIALTGVRRGEALALAWDEVDFAKGSVQISHTLERSKGFEKESALRIGPTKTKRGKRAIEIGAAGTNLLRKARATQAAERLRAGNKWTDEGLVFPTSFGTKCDPRNLYRAVATAATKAGVLDGSPHTFRHSVISQFLEGDYLPDHKISRTMGHSSVSITTETYGHYKSLGEDQAFDKWAEDIGIA